MLVTATFCLCCAELSGQAVAEDEKGENRGVVAVDAEEENRKAGQELKEILISQLKEEIKTLESERSAALRKGKPSKVSPLTKQIKSKKAELSAAESKDADEHYAEMVEKKEAEQQAAAKAARMKALEESRPPIEIVATGIHRNAINGASLTIEIQNTKDRAIEAFEVDVECFDKFDDPVSWPGKGNLFTGLSQSTLEAKKKTRAKWDLHLHRNTAKAKLWITRVKFADGAEWRQTRAEAAAARQIAPAALIE